MSEYTVIVHRPTDISWEARIDCDYDDIAEVLSIAKQIAEAEQDEQEGA